MRGRKPLPTALHQLHGDPSFLGREQLKSRAALDPPADALDPPADFNEQQSAIWRDAVASAPPGVLRHIDTSVLRAWAIAHDTHIRATAAVTSEELLISPSPDPAYPGPRVPNPAISVLNRQAAILTRCAVELGFSPTSRPRLSAGPASRARSTRRQACDVDRRIRPIGATDSHLVGRRSQTQEGALTGRPPR